MIKSIRLVNWRSHADTQLEFRKGTNLLVGIMGAGKSSILEAISFALFGTFPAMERRKLKLDNIVRLNESHAKVIMEFDWDGSTYKAERVVERTKKGTDSHSEIYKNGALVEHGPVAVNSYIEQLTGVNYDLFTRAIYSEQNNIDYFLNLDPRHRKEELDRLLGLDKFELARSNIISVINKVKSKRDTIEERFSKEKITELEQKEKLHSSEVTISENSLKSIESSFSKLTSEYSTTTKKYEEMKKIKELYDSLRKEELRILTQEETLQDQLKGQIFDEASILNLEDKLSRLNEEKLKLQNAARKFDESISILSRELGSTDAKIKSANEAKVRIPVLQDEYKLLTKGASSGELMNNQKEIEQNLLSSESECKSSEREIKEIKESLATLRPGMSKCPVCLADLSDSGISHLKIEKEGLIKKKNEQIVLLRDVITGKKKENETLLSNLRKISLLSEKLSSLEKECLVLEDLNKRKVEIEAELAALSKEKTTISTKTESINSDGEPIRRDIQNMKNLAMRKKEADAAGKKLSEVRSKLLTITFNESSFEETRMSAEKMRLENEKLNSEKKTLDTRLRLSRELLSSVLSELSMMRSMESDIRRLYSLEEQLSLYRNALAEAQVSLRLSLSEAINSAMNEIWSIFYPYHNYHGLRLLANDKDYIFEVNDGSNWRPLETIASGGERASAALALRVALAMILTPNLSWLILDEPTHNLDSEAVELLSSALQFKVPEVVKQTFVITHDEAFMGSDFAASYRLSRDKDKNGETKVDPM